jgi:predicted dehydrogenase
MKEKIGILIVGYGYWSPKLIRNIQKFSELEIVGICEKNESTHLSIQEKHPGIKIYKHYTEALKNPEISAVVIGTVVSSHFRIAKAALEHSKHTLVEKPMAMSEKECKDLIKISQKNNLVFMVDHTYLYSPAIQKLKEITDSGELGEIFMVNSTRLNLGLFQKDINVVWDLVPHDFSILKFLNIKKPTHISASGRKTIIHPLQEDGFESTVYINVYSDNNLIGHFHVSWLYPIKVRQFAVIGSKKMAVYDQLDAEGKIKIYNKRVGIASKENISFEYIDEPAEIVNIIKGEDLEFMIKDFLNSIRNGSQPLSDGNLGLEVVKLLCATQKSLDKMDKKIRL